MPAAGQDEPAPPGPDECELVRGAVSPSLAGIVSRVTGYRETARRHFRMREAASLVVPLIVSFGDSFRIGLRRLPGPDDRFGSFAAGLFAGPVVIESFGASHCIQIDFTPLGARRFFRIPMHELADAMVPIDAVFGAKGASLRERLGNENSWQARFALALAFVEERVGPSVPPCPTVGAAYRALEASGGRIPIGRLATRMGWSRKHLGLRFREDLGIGPKALARMVRFDRTLSLARNGTLGWADIAAACGYADQAHMAREFADLAGQSPGAWRRQAV